MVAELERAHYVVQDNDLVNTPYVLSLNEKRLMLAVLSKIDPMNLPKKGETFEAVITLAEWRELYGTQSKALYAHLYAACERLADRPALRIPTGGARPAVAPWVSYAEPDPQERVIRVTLVYELLLYLKGFVDQFTQYDLLNVRGLKTFHSIRLYELLCQYKTIGKRRFTVEGFRQVMDPSGKYTRWPDLRRFVIEKAIADINAETDLSISWRQLNPGRRVTDIEFSIKHLV